MLLLLVHATLLNMHVMPGRADDEVDRDVRRRTKYFSVVPF